MQTVSKSVDFEKKFRNFEEEIKFKRRQKLLEDKKKNEERQKLILENEKQKQIIQHQKILDKINLIKMKNNELKEIKNNEKNLNNIEKVINGYDRLKQKKHIFYEKNIYKNLEEKFEYVSQLEKYFLLEINIDKKNKNYNLIECDEAVYCYNNFIVKILGYIGSEIALKNIDVYIEKKPTNESIREITFKIITSGLATQMVYKLSFSGNKKIIFKKNIEEWFNYNDSLKKRISESFNISEGNIYFFNYDIQNITVFLITFNKKVNGISLLIKNANLNILYKPLLKYLILSPYFFETKFSKRPNDWPESNLRRGGKRYYPPYEYFGLSLKINDKYSKYDNIWLGKNGNKEGEWAVAYHGVGKGNVFNKVLNIINSNLKEGPGQLLKKNTTIINKDKYNNCEEGVYLAPNIEEAERYADKIKLGTFRRNIQFVIMTRVNPKKIKDPGVFPVNWILRGNDEEIRPYRLLVKITK